MNHLVTWLRGKKTYGIVLITLLYLAGAGLDWWEFSLAVLSAFGALSLFALRSGLKDEIRKLLDRVPLLGLLALGLAGCGTLNPDGPYQGDKTLYDADVAIATSYDLIHTFVTWEHQNRDTLKAKPEITVDSSSSIVAQGH